VWEGQEWAFEGKVNLNRLMKVTMGELQRSEGEEGTVIKEMKWKGGCWGGGEQKREKKVLKKKRIKGYLQG